MKNRQRSNSRKKPSETEEQPSEQDDEKSFGEGYARYTNIIYLMIGSIAFAFGAGYFLDRVLQLSFPVFKIVFSFGGVILALYLVFKELNRK